MYEIYNNSKMINGILKMDEFKILLRVLVFLLLLIKKGDMIKT